MKVLERATIKPISWAKAAGYAVVLILAYYSTFKELYFQWSGEEYSYCLFVPFIVLYLIWEKRTELGRTPSSPSWKGLAPFGIGILLFWLGELSGEFTALYLSLWLVIMGLAWLHVGGRKVRVIWFSFLVMPAMFPLPAFLYSRVTVWAKMISSQLGVRILQIAGMSAFREGNVIDLGFTQLQVVDACSGLRYIVPMMVFGLLLAYWFRGHIWKKTALFLFSLPLSIFLNSFRIALTGMLYPVMGAAAAEGFFHGFSGWFIFMAAFPVFLAGMWLLGKLPPKQPVSMPAPASPEGDDNSRIDETRQGEKGLLQRQFVVGFLLLLLTAGISNGMEFRQKIPINRPLSEFPLQLGDWQGSPETMDRQFSDFLNFSDYIIVNYRDARGKLINFYVAYYQDQRKGESIHSPETCFPMGGWKFCETGNAVVSLGPGNSAMPVNRALIEKDGVRELAYFWFPQRGRILTKIYQLKLFTFWDALTKQRTDGALVRVVTPVYDSEQVQDAEHRLQSFTGLIVPALKGFLPDNYLM